MISKTFINDQLISASSLTVSINNHTLQYIEYFRNKNKYHMLHSSINPSILGGLKHVFIDGNLCVLLVEESKKIDLVEAKQICI